MLNSGLLCHNVVTVGNIRIFFIVPLEQRPVNKEYIALSVIYRNWQNLSITMG